MIIREEAISSTKPRTRLKVAQKIVWVLLLIVVPLGFNLWGQHPFVMPKVLLLRTLVWLLATVTVVDYWLHGRSLRRDLQANPLLGAVGLLVFVLVVTTATAVNWRLSLWGSLERGQGTLTLLTYLLLFLLTTNYCRSFARARSLLVWLVITAVPLVIISGLQAVGLDPFGFVSDARSALYATLGRANFLGAYLAMLTPLTLALVLLTKEATSTTASTMNEHVGDAPAAMALQRLITQGGNGRLGWLLLLLAELFMIGLTMARGAWLATLFALSLFALLWWRPQLPRFWRWVGGIAVGFLFLSGPILVWVQGQAQFGSTAARLAIWQGTLTLIGQRPLLGYGADSLGIIFPAVYAPELVYYQGRDYFVDRAHNLLLDWAVVAGLPGLLAFSFLLVLFVVVLMRALRQPLPMWRRGWLIAILAAVLGNVANNLVSFDVTPTAMASWFLMGVGVALTLPPMELSQHNVSKRPFLQWMASALLLLGVGALIWLGNGRLLWADVTMHSVTLHGQAGRWDKATLLAEQAVDQWPFAPSYHLQLSQIYWQRAAAEPMAANHWLDEAEMALATAVQLHPQDAHLWLQLAQFYTASGQQQGRNRQPLANHAYQQALTLAPNHATIYTAAGRAYLEANDLETAVTLLRQAVKLDASNGQAYIYLGTAELAVGRLTIARDDYLEAVRLLPQSGVAYAGLAESYWQLGQRQAAWQATERALQHDPQNQAALTLQQTIKATP